MADLHATVESCLKIFYFKEMEMVTKRKPEVFFSQHKLQAMFLFTIETISIGKLYLTRHPSV